MTVDSPTKQQFYKTQWCRRPGCTDGSRCRYAHSEAELRSKPDLSKTRLCPSLTTNPGKVCEKEDCKFAHSEEELKATEQLRNTKLCPRGEKCDLKACRFAHSESELKQKRRKNSEQEDSTSGAPVPGCEPPDTNSADAERHGERILDAQGLLTQDLSLALRNTNTSASVLQPQGGGDGRPAYQQLWVPEPDGFLPAPASLKQREINPTGWKSCSDERLRRSGVQCVSPFLPSSLSVRNLDVDGLEGEDMKGEQDAVRRAVNGFLVTGCQPAGTTYVDAEEHQGERMPDTRGFFTPAKSTEVEDNQDPSCDLVLDGPGRDGHRVTMGNLEDLNRAEEDRAGANRFQSASEGDRLAFGFGSITSDTERRNDSHCEGGSKDFVSFERIYEDVINYLQSKGMDISSID